MPSSTIKNSDFEIEITEKVLFLADVKGMVYVLNSFSFETQFKFAAHDGPVRSLFY